MKRRDFGKALAGVVACLFGGGYPKIEKSKPKTYTRRLVEIDSKSPELGGDLDWLYNPIGITSYNYIPEKEKERNGTNS